MAQNKSPFGISAYFQNSMYYLASLFVFREASKIINISEEYRWFERQIQLIRESYGEKIKQ